MKTTIQTVVLAIIVAGAAAPAYAGTPAKAPAVSAAAGASQKISGTLVTIDPKARVVKLRIGTPGTEETFTLTPSATAKRAGKEVSLETLKVGDHVTATKDGDQIAALSVRGK